MFLSVSFFSNGLAYLNSLSLNQVYRLDSIILALYYNQLFQIHLTLKSRVNNCNIFRISFISLTTKLTLLCKYRWFTAPMKQTVPLMCVITCSSLQIWNNFSACINNVYHDNVNKQNMFIYTMKMLVYELII